MKFTKALNPSDLQSPPGLQDAHGSCTVSTGSPSRGGDAAVYVKDMNQPSVLTPFYSVLVPISVFLALSTVFHSINYPENSASSLFSSGFISALLVLLSKYLFRRVSFSPDIILCG